MYRNVFLISLSLSAFAIGSVGEGVSSRPQALRCSAYFAVRSGVIDRVEAARERRAIAGLSPDQRAVRVVPRFATLMPIIREILDGVPTSAHSLPYAILNADGERAVLAVSNVGQAIVELRAQADERERTGGITQSWFPEFVLEALAIEEIASRNWAEASLVRGEPRQAEIRRLMSAIRQQEVDPKAGDRYENVFSRVIAVKREFQQWLRIGFLAWPSVVRWSVGDFRDWHLGTRVLAIAQNRVVFYDGARRSRFFFFVHDALAHPMPAEFLPYRHEFTDLETRVHRAIEAREPDEAILLRLLWFGTTHEIAALYRAYTEMRSDFGLELVSQLVVHLRQAATGVPGGEIGLFVSTLMNPYFHQSDLSPAQRALSRAELTAVARRAVDTFYSILREESEHHRDWLAGSR